MAESKYAPQARYVANKCKRYVINLSKNTDKDILAHLEKIENVQGYIKNLILSDIAKTNK